MLQRTPISLLPRTPEGRRAVGVSIVAAGSVCALVAAALARARDVPGATVPPSALTVAVAWVPWLAVSVLTGVTALRALVTGPVARQLEPPEEGAELLAQADLRLVRIGALAAAVLLPASVVQLAYQPAKSTFAFGEVGTALTADLAGYLDLARLVVTALAVALLVPAALWPARFAGALGRVLPGAFVLGLLELLARGVPSKPPADIVRAVAGTVATLAHLLGAAIWVGGLTGMTALAAASMIPERHRRQFWAAAVRRFALVAMASVLALTVSGLWLTWSHVGGLDQFVTTLYGRTLTVKLLLFGGLLALGAFHEFWLLPRVEAFRAVGEGRQVIRLVSGHFRGAVAAEVMLGVAVLLVVPLLSGSARSQALAASALTRTGTAGSTLVTLRTSSLVAGRADYLIDIPDGAARQVSVSFAAPALGLAHDEVPAAGLGDGHFRLSGLSLPAAGTWDVKVVLDGNVPQAARFSLPVTAKAPKPVKAAPPQITVAVWAWGGAAALGLLGVLLGAGRVSRLLTQRHIRAAGARGPVPAGPHPSGAVRRGTRL